MDASTKLWFLTPRVSSVSRRRQLSAVALTYFFNVARWQTHSSDLAPIYIQPTCQNWLPDISVFISVILSHNLLSLFKLCVVKNAQKIVLLISWEMKPMTVVAQWVSSGWCSSCRLLPDIIFLYPLQKKTWLQWKIWASLLFRAAIYP